MIDFNFLKEVAFWGFSWSIEAGRPTKMKFVRIFVIKMVLREGIMLNYFSNLRVGCDGIIYRKNNF